MGTASGGGRRIDGDKEECREDAVGELGTGLGLAKTGNAGGTSGTPEGRDGGGRRVGGGEGGSAKVVDCGWGWFCSWNSASAAAAVVFFPLQSAPRGSLWLWKSCQFLRPPL
jgi:hypothetical protein